MLFAGEKVYLWPAGKMPDAQPHQIAAMTDEAGKPGFKADEHRAPYLEWFDPPAAEKRTGACMILLSGGAYECLCDVGHIQNWTKMLTEAGIQCVNLVYRSPRPKGLPIYQTAWEDGQRAVRLVRNEAKKRGIDPERIGVMGQSAGSHLATLLATSSQTPAYAKVDELDEIPCHINWACTHSLAYGLTDGYGIPNSRMGDQPDVKLD
ncbi:MAG TPA: alpha/beta hydrolase, partial [Verrucomicrobia bacterium]|nr:alpha/beta hydrolase [Verrucomicrobiota bacterium]